VQEAIEESGFEVTEVVCGGAKGVDELCSHWAEFNEIPVKHFPAKWDDLDAPDALIKKGKYGKYNAKAGSARNEEMALHADQLIAVWDGQSYGTGDMILKAHKHGLRIYVKIVKE
jgi:hypothetical protein